MSINNSVIEVLIQTPFLAFSLGTETNKTVPFTHKPHSLSFSVRKDIFQQWKQNKNKKSVWNEGHSFLSALFYSESELWVSPDCWPAVGASRSVLPSTLPTSLCLSLNAGDELAAASDLPLNQLLTRSWEVVTFDRSLISLWGSSQPLSHAERMRKSVCRYVSAINY